MYSTFIARLAKDPIKKDGFYLGSFVINYYDSKLKELKPLFISFLLTDEVAKHKEQYLTKGRQFVVTATLTGTGIFNEKPSLNFKITNLDFAPTSKQEGKEEKEQLFDNDKQIEEENIF